MFDLRRLGKVGEISMVGTNGNKLSAIRAHLDKNIGQVYNMDTSLKTYPGDNVKDRDSCK
jgi:D-galacturonate reductase